MAMTGSAASHISAVTLHSATGIPIEDNDTPKTTASNTRRITEWTGRRYLIIDEINMMNCKMLINLNMNLRETKSRYENYFNEINVIFMNNFL